MDLPQDKTRVFAKSLKCVLYVFMACILSCAICLLVGCAGDDKSEQVSQIASKQSENGPLKVGVQYNALSLPAVYADEKGYFEEAGLDVDLFTFVNGAEENKALENGDVEIASDGLASVYMLATGDFSWIGESDSGSSTVAIYIKKGSPAAEISGQIADNPNIKGSAETLKGLTVVGAAGTMEEWVAISYFSKFGLNAGTDFEFIGMDRTDAANSVINGETDVFVATDVDYCRMMEENGFVALATGDETTGVTFNNGYVVSNKVLESRYDDLVAFLQAVYKAAEVLDSDDRLRDDFAYEYYKSNGKPATLKDVKRETKVRSFLVPSDFTAPDYRLGSGVLEVGKFNAEVGALDDAQLSNILNSLNTKVLEDAFGITVKAATLDEEA